MTMHDILDGIQKGLAGSLWPEGWAPILTSYNGHATTHQVDVIARQSQTKRLKRFTITVTERDVTRGEVRVFLREAAGIPPRDKEDTARQPAGCATPTTADEGEPPLVKGEASAAIAAVCFIGIVVIVGLAILAPHLVGG